MPTAGLAQVVALLQPWTTAVMPAGDLEMRVVPTMDLAEVAALAVTLRMFGQQSGFRAGCRHHHKPTFVIVSQEDRYDRTF
ncbi:MAG: hypothetical protein ACUVRZ_06865 [Desulfobacca sp.]|uniref:hypothetical protein n=1 Tax=Desulfobacca sp. TaxID=2067990 RepID=UPI00404A930A